MKWSFAPPPDPESLASLCQHVESVSPFLASLLIQRGITGQEQAERFLRPMLQHFQNPHDIEAVRLAARRVVVALEAGQKIGLFGDYDVDGMTSVALLVSAFRELGVEVLWRVPHRLQGGYGLNMERAKELADLGCQLLITVDCGTASLAEVDYLNSRGVDVIVTDHHQVHGELPRAAVLVNPQMWEPTHVFRDLAGVGVAFLVLCALAVELRSSARFGHVKLDPKRFLDLVALGTVADMVPLHGQNRLLVNKGLLQLAQDASRPGLVALKESSGCADRVLDAGSIAWYMAPRLNAAGRMDDASVAVELLLARERSDAVHRMKGLEQLNVDRRLLEQRIFDEAQQQVVASGEAETEAPLVLSSSAWHLGVVGIVASRVCERFHRPALLFVEDGVMATGSARSVPGFDIAGALAQRSDMYERFGGHNQAAGVTLRVDRIPELREHLRKAFEESRDGPAQEPELLVDAQLPLRDLGPNHVADIERLAPFGTANPEPTLASMDVLVAERKTIRNDSLKLVLDDGGRRVEALWWRVPDVAVRVAERVDVAYLPEMRTFHGTTALSLRIKDLRPAAR